MNNNIVASLINYPRESKSLRRWTVFTFLVVVLFSVNKSSFVGHFFDGLSRFL